MLSWECILNELKILLYKPNCSKNAYLKIISFLFSQFSDINLNKSNHKEKRAFGSLERGMMLHAINAVLGCISDSFQGKCFNWVHMVLSLTGPLLSELKA